MEIASKHTSRRNFLGTIQEGVPGHQDDDLSIPRGLLFEDIGSTPLPAARHSYADFRSVDRPPKDTMSNEAPAAYSVERRGIQHRQSSGLKRLIEERLAARRAKRTQTAAQTSDGRVPVSDELMKSGPFRALGRRARNWRKANLQSHAKQFCSVQGQQRAAAAIPMGADGDPIEITIALIQSDVVSTSGSGIASSLSSASMSSAIIGSEPPEPDGDGGDKEEELSGCMCWRRKKEGRGASIGMDPSASKSGADSFISTTGTTKSHGRRHAHHQYVLCVKATEGNGIIGALGGEGKRGKPTDVYAAKAWLKMQVGVLVNEKTRGRSAIVFVHRNGAVCALDIDLRAAMVELRSKITAGVPPTAPCRVPRAAIRVRCLFDSRRQPVLFDHKRNAIATASLQRRRSGLRSRNMQKKPPPLDNLNHVQERFLSLASMPPNWSGESFLFLYGHDKHLKLRDA